MRQRRQDIDTVTIHCSATRYNEWFDSKDIDQWHKSRNFPPYDDATGTHYIGYHLIIVPDGRLEICRPFEVVGAHVKGQNRNNIGVCLIGGLGQDDQPKEDGFAQFQYDTLYEVLWSMKAPTSDFYLPNLRRILGHRDHSPDLNGDGQIERNEWMKACPCFDVGQFLSDVGLAEFRRLK